MADLEAPQLGAVALAKRDGRSTQSPRVRDILFIYELKRYGAKEIAEILGGSTSSVQQVLNRHGHFKNSTHMNNVVPHKYQKMDIRVPLSLIEEAHKRQWSMSRMVNELLGAVAKDDMYKAVLDD